MAGYPSLPASRRRHYEIDGTVVGWNLGAGIGAGMLVVATAAQMLTLDEETPSVGSTPVISTSAVGTNMYVLFPEKVDLAYFITSVTFSGGSQTVTGLSGSSDTTTGNDGTWTAITSSGQIWTTAHTGDWWRSVSPSSLTANNTGLRGIRFTYNGSTLTNIYALYIWGTKTSGQTPDDIIFLESDDATEYPQDDDFGSVMAGTSPITHTNYVMNTSATKTANTITVHISGSDNAEWQVSLDNITYGSSQSISSLAAGASQIVYTQFTPPSPASGVYRPYAAYLEADVTSWT